VDYTSTRELESTVCAGVRFRIARISFGRRLELTRRVRELGRCIRFDEAGEAVEGRLSAAIARAEIDRLYLDWGMIGIAGLRIDGRDAEAADLIEAGPEELCREIVTAIRHECGLTEEERKNESSPSTSSSPARPHGSATHAEDKAWSNDGAVRG
jgi:hypothetical protein